MKNFIYKVLVVIMLGACSLFIMINIPGVKITSSLDAEAALLSSRTQNLDPHILKLGLMAYNNAVKKGLTQSKILTIVDFSKPSSQPRFWVINLKNHQVLFYELVAHGKGSGEAQAVSFSDSPGSNKSSLGLYRTDETYDGKHGYSLKLEGLDQGLNTHVRARAVVVHSAEYVSPEVVKERGRLGRSNGCLALDPAVTKPVIDTIKNGSLIFVYGNSASLKQSKFLMT